MAMCLSSCAAVLCTCSIWPGIVRISPVFPLPALILPGALLQELVGAWGQQPVAPAQAAGLVELRVEVGSIHAPGAFTLPALPCSLKIASHTSPILAVCRMH